MADNRFVIRLCMLLFRSENIHDSSVGLCLMYGYKGDSKSVLNVIIQATLKMRTNTDDEGNHGEVISNPTRGNCFLYQF